MNETAIDQPLKRISAEKHDLPALIQSMSAMISIVRIHPKRHCSMDDENRVNQIAPQENDQAADSDFSSILTLAKSGDSDAIGQLCEFSRKYLLLIANQDLSPQSLQKFGASDVVQQSLIVANNKITGFTGATKGEFLAWMRQIVVNECRTATRSYHHTDKRNVNRELPIDGRPQDSAQFQLGDHHLTPSTEAVNDEQFQLVRTILAQMSELDRQVIEMRNWHELPFDEIGQSIGKSGDAARKIWSRAIIKLEQELDKLNAI